MATDTHKDIWHIPLPATIRKAPLKHYSKNVSNAQICNNSQRTILMQTAAELKPRPDPGSW